MLAIFQKNLKTLRLTFLQSDEKHKKKWVPLAYLSQTPIVQSLSIMNENIFGFSHPLHGHSYTTQ